ncbi:hypothetical protein HED60_13875 [Planctomycetales bacterium ZRK34]|nr:hypothetical protein HED60_13875 [Planctomycetales bacterium ZRK34]
MSFYSDAPGRDVYAGYAQTLEQDLQRHQDVFRIERLPYRGTWLATCHAKPSFLLAALEEQQQPIVWLDVDSRLLTPIPLIDPDSYDIAAPQGSNQNTGLITISLEVAMLYINNTDNAKRFLREWRRRCDTSDLPVTDHYHFLQTWEVLRHTDIRLKVLPNSFCCQKPCEETVVQLQRSRCLSRKVELARVMEFHHKSRMQDS